MNRRTMHVLSRLAALAACLAPLAVLAACQAARPFTGPAGAPTPFKPHVELDASATTLYVGDEVTITALAIGFGQEIYTITLSSGGEVTTNYGNGTKIVKADPLFEFVSVRGSTGIVRMLLRAKKPGKATLKFFTQGETYETWGGGTGAWNWDRASTTLDLTIAEAPAPAANPTARMTATPAPHVDITASATSLRVGDEVTITGRAVGFDQMRIYDIYLSSDGVFYPISENPTDIRKPNPLFEVVSVTRGSDRVVLVLRAQKPGKASLGITVSGNVAEYWRGTEVYRWDILGDAIDLTISEAATPAN